jgi:hypothetical protein
MGKNKNKRKQTSKVNDVFKVAEGRANKAKHQKIKKKVLKIKANNEDKVQKLNESADVMQEDVRKPRQVQEVKLNELKRTDFTLNDVNVDEATDIFNKL